MREGGDAFSICSRGNTTRSHQTATKEEVDLKANIQKGKEMKHLNFENIVRLSVERFDTKLSERGVELIDLESLRRFRVERARDLVAKPLTAKEFLRRPFIPRSRWLISGYDVNSNLARTFYVGKESLLKLALCESGEKWPTRSIGRPFGPDGRDRMVLVSALQELLTRDLGDFWLGVYCDDLRVVS